MITIEKGKLVLGRIKIRWGLRLGTKGLRRIQRRFFDVNLLPKEAPELEDAPAEEEAPAEEVGD